MNARPALLALSLAFGTVQAAPANPDLISLAPDQTLRLKVIAQTDTQAEPPTGPCQVFLGFFGQDGKLVGDPEGLVADAHGLTGNPAGLKFARQLTLEPGQSAHLDIRGRDALPTGAENQRAELMPAILVQPDNGAQGQCPGVIASVEMLGPETQQAHVSYNDAIPH
jgi:hypothetical protein